MKTLLPRSSSRKFAALLCCCLALAAARLPAGVGAQTTACPGGTPASNGPLTAWPQNSIISVNVNSSCPLSAARVHQGSFHRNEMSV